MQKSQIRGHSITRYFDLHDQERDAGWLAENYGAVFTQGWSDTYRAAELREAEGEPTLTVTVRKDGEAKPGVEVKCFFFGYEVGMLSSRTDGGGEAIFPLPQEFTYPLSGYGTHWLNVDGLRVIGLGVPENVAGWRHLDIVFEEAE